MWGGAGFRRDSRAKIAAEIAEWLAAAASVEVLMLDAREVEPVDAEVTFIDPPYANTTKYGPGDVTRDDVIDMALRHAETSRIVAVFENEAIPELLSAGWHSIGLKSRIDTRKVHSVREVMTYRIG